MSENIDPSQFINKRKTPLVNSNRMDKGDMIAYVEDGHISNANCIDNSILCWLITRGFLEPYHQWDAMVFMDLRRAYESNFGTKWGSVNISSDSAALSPGQATKLYDAIRHELGLPKGERVIRIVMHAVDTQALYDHKNNRPFELVAEAANEYRHAFDKLIKAMEEVDRKREELLAKMDEEIYNANRHREKCL